ncbi:MAG: TIGR02710 family CRISPR-associated protein [Ignavibacterium sp.]|jgi:CRISPR-associated protein (TIGR02710 family)|uniref:TIGR02710 family CRISPR-associated CARF protein n=1 Tax=Ignavibacterium sp. TaxID=2651167 RepID=UPI0032989922
MPDNKKVLLMTIGTGATGADIAHGLFFSINDSNPDLLVLIGSSKSFETTLPALKNLIEQNKIRVEIIEKIIDEINDLEFLHFEFSKIINELKEKGFLVNKINVDYTSGTKAMSAALVSAAIANKVGSISYVYGERGEGGRVKSGTERRSSLVPIKIFSAETFQKAIEYFNSYRFTTCLELLNNYEFHPEYHEKVELLKYLSDLFDCWDKFEFNRAFEHYKKINVDSMKVFNLKSRFESYYLPLLIKLKSEEYSYQRLIDLTGNADRRASEGRYDDAIARLYRALEMCGQIEFLKEFHCSTSDVIIDKIPVNLKEEVNNKYLDKKDNKIKIPLYGTFELLSKINNTVGKVFMDQWNNIKKCLTVRNNSILAHGNDPVSKKSYYETRLIILNFILAGYENFSPVEFPKLKC